MGNKDLFPSLSIATWAEWEHAYNTARERHFFLSPHWGHAIATAYRMTPRILLFRFLTQQVVLPCFINRRLRGVLLGMRSMPLYNYGGLLSEEPVIPTITEGIARRLSQEWWLHTLQVAASPRLEIPGWEEYKALVFSAQVLDIVGGYAAVWQHVFDGKQRTKIRKALRAGLKIRRDNSAQAIDAFYKLHLMSVKRLNIQPEPKILFELLLTNAELEVELWLVSKDNQDITGLIVANNGRDTVHALFCVSDTDYWEYCPNNLVYASAIEEACNRGFTQFDFLTSGRLANVEHFKESFGAIPVHVREYWLRGWLPSLKSNLVAAYRRISLRV